jgi:hypothetical protein
MPQGCGWRVTHLVRRYPFSEKYSKDALTIALTNTVKITAK